MTTMTIAGPVADDLGHLMGSTVALRASNYKQAQDAHIPILVGHQGSPIGRVVHLEYAHRRLHAVGVVDFDDLADPGLDDDGDGGALWYWSPTTAYNHTRTDLILEELSVTRHPATVAAQPLHFHAGEPDRNARNWLIRNAADAIRQRGRGSPLRIRGITDHATMPTGPMRYTGGSALGQVLAVR